MRAPVGSMTPGEQLRGWRLDQQITQRVLGMRMGVCNQKIARWELGHGRPSLENARWLERRAGIPATAWRELPTGGPGADLRAWRIRHGVTQGQLADRVGCSANAVGWWEQEKRVPLPICAQRLERITGLPAEAWREMRRAS